MTHQLKTIQQLSIDIEGWKPGELYVIAGGRQTGKSYYQKQILNAIYGTNLCKEILLPMKEEKYKFSRANWYQAEFDDRHYFEVDAWCEQHFGKHPRNPDAWSRWWHKFHNSILFRDEKDYVLFMLRWS
jgi:hypothetical protein